MKIEELEAEVKVLKDQMRVVRDIEAIKRLQNSYGYFLEKFMSDEIINCFADGHDTAAHFLGVGSYLGKEGIVRCFTNDPEKQNPPGWHAYSKDQYFLHPVLMGSPVVDVAPDGKTAQGRFYGFLSGFLGPFNDEVKKKVNLHVIWLYENDYVKEDGVWKIKVLRLGEISTWGAMTEVEMKAGEQQLDQQPILEWASKR